MIRTLRFVEDCYYNGELAHKAGDVESIDDSLGYALRWVVLGKAELLDSTPLESEKIVNKAQLRENKKRKTNK